MPRIGRYICPHICPLVQVTVFYKKTVFSLFFAFVLLKIAVGCAIIKKKWASVRKNTLVKVNNMKKMKRWMSLGLAALSAFAMFGFGGCGDKKGAEITVYMPDGAPALALAGAMSLDVPDDGITYRVVDSSVIATKVSANDPADNADVCILPVNVAAKKLGDGSAYQMIGLVTQGNLYFISNQDVADVDDLSVLQGKTVGLAQIANVPGLTLKAAVNRNGGAWQELKEGAEVAEDKVNLQGLANNNAITGELPYYLAAEPFVTMKTMGGAFRVVGDLQTLYNGVSSEQVGYPQAVMVAKRSLIEKNKAWVSGFVQMVENKQNWAETADTTDVYLSIVRHFDDKERTPVFKLETLTKDCISRCGIAFARTKDCMTRVDAFLSELVQIAPAATNTVSQDFYWLG